MTGWRKALLPDNASLVLSCLEMWIREEEECFAKLYMRNKMCML